LADAAVELDDESGIVVAGGVAVCAKAVAVNRAAMRVAISFFMFNPLLNGK